MRARLHPGSPTDQPISDPSSSPYLQSLFSKVLSQFLLPQIRSTKLIKLYYQVHSKYWSWKRRHRQQRLDCYSALNDWNHVENWTPTDIVNDITLPSHDKYYDINYPFYRDVFVLGHVTSPNANVLSMNEMNPPKIRSVRKPKTEPASMPIKAIILDSGASIHIIDNPNFLSWVTFCIGQWINTIRSCIKCTKTGRLYEALNPLLLPDFGYLYQPNGISNIISLSLLSGSDRITMDTEVENAFGVDNRHDVSYMKYKQWPRTNLYTYIIEEGKENDVLIHSTVEGESD